MATKHEVRFPVWSLVVLSVAGMMVASCGSSAPTPAGCSTDADCSSGAVCRSGACQQTVTLAITSPASGTTTNGTVAVTVSLSGAPPSSIELQLDGARLGVVAPPGYSFSWDTTSVAEGPHRLRAHLILGSTPYDSAEVNLTVKRTPPAAPTVTVDSPTNATTVPVSGTAEASGTVKIYEGTSLLATTTATSSGTWSTTLASLIPGTHGLSVTVTDQAGNVSLPSQVTLVIDRTGLTVVSRTPAPRAASADLRQSIQAVFSEAIAPATASPTSVVLTNVTGGQNSQLTANLALSPDGTQLTIEPSPPIVVTGADALDLKCTLSSSITDLAGNPLAVPTPDWTFTVPAFLELGTTLGAPAATPGGMAWDSQGRLWVAVIETAGAVRLASVRRWNGTQWSRMPPLNLDLNHSAQEISLAVTPAGDPVVAWTEKDSFAVSQLYVRKYSNGLSSSLGTGVSLNEDPFADAGGPSVTINPINGQPVVGWNETGVTHYVVVKRFDGATWPLVGGGTIPLQNSSGGTRFPVSLAMNGESPVVAWQDFGVGGGPLKYAVKVFSSGNKGTGPWMGVGSIPDPNHDSVRPSLAMDGTAVVLTYVTSMACNDCPGLIQVTKYTGTAWEPLGGNLNREASQIGNVPVVKVRGPGRYVVSWWENPTVGRPVHVSEWTGTAWTPLESKMLVADKLGQAEQQVLALDAAGVPTVAWSESPSKSLYVFRQNQPGPAPPAVHSISGTVSGAVSAGVTVTLSGADSATTVTGSGGTYTFSGLLDGSYTVTPTLSGFTFAPASAAVTLGGSDVGGRNFSSVAAPATIVAVAAGDSHSLLVKSDGTLWGWGANNVGNLGVLAATSTLRPLQLGTGFSEVAGGIGHTVGRKFDGSVWTWGWNVNGQLGIGAVSSQEFPAQMGAGYSRISANSSGSFGIKAAGGELWAWGLNNVGQLGDGTVVDRWAPVLTGTGFETVYAAYAHGMAKKTDGSLWGWGFNANGQIGDGSTLNRTTPVLVGTGYSAVAVGAAHTLALKPDGTLWAWGNNFYGQIGDGTRIQHLAPVLVLTNVATVATRSHHNLAIKRDGTLWAWGRNGNGEVGNGTIVDQILPVQIGSGYLLVATGVDHSVAVDGSGRVWTWGLNNFGQLGDGSLTSRPVPTRIPAF